jgi:hypothetical protein
MEESQKELTLKINEIQYKEMNTDELYKILNSRLDDLNKEFKSIKRTR